jgi:hypothetical protein
MRKFFTVSSCLLVFFAFVFLAGLPLRAQLTEDERNTIDIVKNIPSAACRCRERLRAAKKRLSGRKPSRLCRKMTDSLAP